MSTPTLIELVEELEGWVWGNGGKTLLDLVSTIRAFLPRYEAALRLAEAVDEATVAAAEYADLDTTTNARAVERTGDIADLALADYRKARS